MSLRLGLVLWGLLGGVWGGERPNVVLALADDLGYGDVGCYGAETVRTPRLDAFAEQGLRLTHCYAAAANCSPSRAGLLTGRIPWRLGIHNWIPMLSPMHVEAEEITVAMLLRDAGYETAHVGKWHLNGMFNLPGQPQPDDHGFQYWFSTQNNALPNHRNPYNFVRNRIPVGPLEGYAAPLVTKEAIRWLRQERDPGKPFFLFVCYHEPHEPIATHPRYEALYDEFPDPAQRAHHGNITQLDAAFGDLLDALEKDGLADSTLVVFTSDNGPALTGIHPYGSSGPLREKKGYLYEGGIRVPGIVRWPGVVAPGSESAVPVSGVDWLPTLCQLAKVAPPEDRKLDGTSLVPMLNGQPLSRDQPLYWHFVRARGDIKVALRDGAWKLAATLTGPEIRRGADITAELNRIYREAGLEAFELYHLGRDPGETENLLEAEPERFAALKREMKALYREVRDESPIWPEWEFARYEAGRIEWPPYRGQKRRKQR